MTRQQRRFCEEYLVDLNGAQAAIRAGYSKRSARQRAHDLLQRDDVRECVAKMQRERSERVQVTQDMVVAELARIGFSNLTELIEVEDGKITLRLEVATADAKAAIRELTAEGGIKLHNKERALELLGKHLGMFKEPVLGLNVHGSNELGEVTEISIEIVRPDSED